MQRYILRVAIIEDDDSARENLCRTLEQYFPEIALVGMADGVESGIQLVHEHKPNVLLLNVDLKDGSGFDIAERFANEKIWIIFISAQSEPSLTAFNYLSLSFLLKPVDRMALAKAFQKIRQANSLTQEQLSEVVNLTSRKNFQRIALPAENEIRLVKLDQIVYCRSDKNYTEIFLVDGSRITTSKTLKHYEKLLPAEDFMRIHQRHLINLAHIRSYLREDGGIALMEGGAKLEVSQRKRNELLSWLSN